ncbi:NADH dehydrogenase [ubiquinone] iron-sulfur protein 8, mitochondrial isoform X1 [Pipra filicauda]|uniref:NADH dehydrogenase [ubiquinone] iron-sulfur protein 8, mitochondrial isoform X1 n=1 Tax=Pipra filicauda TaxID=649802 RepID=A0A7R5L7K3_9PASS|nr:NADH dehydrogenase [ubiquinone] iron-sulfur protein 8, mitochondrial isoform X1 [Pipra filicauda]
MRSACGGDQGSGRRRVLGAGGGQGPRPLRGKLGAFPCLQPLRFPLHPRTGHGGAATAVPGFPCRSPGPAAPAQHQHPQGLLQVRQRPGARHGHALHHRPRRADPALDRAHPRPGHDHELPVPGAGHHQLPVREGPAEPAVPRGARAAPLPVRGGALHCLQALRGRVPGTGHHHRGRAPRRWQPPHHPLRHRHDQVHLLWVLPGGLSRGCHRGGSQLRVFDGDTRGAALQQGEAAQQR